MSPSRLAELESGARAGLVDLAPDELAQLVSESKELAIVRSMTPRQFEQWRIRRALASKVPIIEIAKRLGMGRATLYRRLGEMGEL